MSAPDRATLDAVIIIDRALNEFPDVRSRASYAIACLTSAGYTIAPSGEEG